MEKTTLLSILSTIVLGLSILACYYANTVITDILIVWLTIAAIYLTVNGFIRLYSKMYDN